MAIMLVELYNNIDCITLLNESIVNMANWDVFLLQTVCNVGICIISKTLYEFFCTFIQMSTISSFSFCSQCTVYNDSRFFDFLSVYYLFKLLVAEAFVKLL